MIGDAHSRIEAECDLIEPGLTEGGQIGTLGQVLSCAACAL